MDGLEKVKRVGLTKLPLKAAKLVVNKRVQCFTSFLII